MTDPPVNPEHDGPGAPVRQAEEAAELEDGADAPGRVLYDENRVPG